MKFSYKTFHHKLYNFFQFFNNKSLKHKHFFNLFINIFFYFFIGYFFANFINFDFFISFKLNQFLFTNRIFFLLSFFIFFLLSIFYYVKKKNFQLFLIFLMLFSSINGFNFFLKCKNFAKENALNFKESFNIKENHFFLGFVKNNPIQINNKIIFEFAPYFITSSGEEIDRIKKFIFKPKKNSSKLIAITDITKFKDIPKYKDCYILNGNLRTIEKEEINFLYKIGIKNDFYFSLENIKFYEKTKTYISASDFFVKTFRQKYKNFFNKIFKNNFKMNYSLIDWLIFGEKSNIPNILKTKRIIFNPLFLIIESKFFIWFIFIIPIFFIKNKKLIYKLTIFIFCSFLLFIFDFFQNFYRMTNNIILFSVLFSFFYSIINLKKEKSLKFTFIILNYINIFFLKNYFLYSERFFIYFCLTSIMCIYFFEIIDNLAKKFLNNWKLLGYTFFIIFGHFIFLINWNFLFSVFHIKYLKIFFILFLLSILGISHLLSYYHPIINMHFRKIPLSFRMLLIFWLINNFFVFLPMAVFYGENFSLSSVILLFPLFCFLVVIFFLYFFVYISFFLLNFINLNIFKICMIILARIFYKYLTSTIYRLTENDIPKDINIFLFLFIFLGIIFVFYFVNKIHKDKYINFVKNIKVFKNKFQLMLYSGNIKIIMFCSILFLLTIYFIASYIKNKDSLNCYFFKNNYASYCYLKTYDKQNILFIDIKNLDFIPINLMFENFYSDFYFLKYLNINRIDTLIINNFEKNDYIFPFLNEFYKNRYIKNNHSKIYINAPEQKISKIKNLNIEDIFFDEKKTNNFLKLNSFFEEIKKLNIKTYFMQDNIAYIPLEKNFRKHFLSINLLCQENDIFLNIENDIDKIIISNKFLVLDKKDNLKEKILFDDYNKIFLQSYKFSPKIKSRVYLDWQYLNIASFGNKIQIKCMEKENV